MGIIKILDMALVNKIAAGEVIERPASAVKELIENSIDANANVIEIAVIEGGKSQIIVRDDGNGMSQEDAILSVKRHATSKIDKEEDLFNIWTLGFRGEALASISAISKMTLKTKNSSAIVGVCLEVENSEIKSIKPIGSDDGTEITLSKLFYNLPARKKYLGTVEYEFSKILDIVTRYALINYEITFKLFHNNRMILLAPKTNDVAERLANIYGKDIAKELIAITHNSKILSFSGFISKPTLTRKKRDLQSIYINKRYVRSKEIIDYIYTAYHTMLHSDRNPVIFLNFTIEPRYIDVNIHPKKEIVKIEDLPRFKDEIVNTLRLTLIGNHPIPNANLNEVRAKQIHDYFIPEKQIPLTIREQSHAYSGTTIIERESDLENTNKIGAFIVLGQINKTYILAENKDGLMIIDQHAAQERINYERFLREVISGSVKTQRLIKPKIIELSKQEAFVLSENLTILKKIGFDIAEFGDNSFLLRSVPMIFEIFENTLLTDIITELSNIEPNLIDEIKERRIISRACRASIKAGDELTIPYMTNLINQLEQTEQPYTCPHGRPTIINVSIAELERKFKRVC